MIPSSKFQSSSPFVMERGPFLRIDSRAMLTSLSYSWVDLILYRRVVFPSTVIVVGRVVLMAKNLVIRRMHSLFSFAIPSLRSGCLDSASDLFWTLGL